METDVAYSKDPGDVESFLANFRFVPDGDTTLADALCSFLKEQITFGHIKGGAKIPTMQELSKATGLSFNRTRGVVQRLVREGYVHSRPHSGTFVRSRGKNVLRGRVLVALPAEDVCRFYPAQLFDTVRRRLSAKGYATSIITFSLDPDDKLIELRSELLRATDLVIAMRATPNVQKCLAESGVNHILSYCDRPTSDRPWIRFSDEEAISMFVDHCAKAGVRHVVQVRFEGNEMFDVGPALSARGIESSWMTILRTDAGPGRFDGIVRCAYEMFNGLPRENIPDLLLFWNAFAAQGALMALLYRGIRVPEDVRIVTVSHKGFGPAYIKPLTRFESDPAEAGEKIANFILAVLAKGRIPSPPVILPQYIFGATFPF